ncbi:MAG: terminase large subunit domain-containing protein [Christensenellales bacterium]
MRELLKKLNLINNEILRRKKNNKLLTYNTGKVVHEKQILFHKCKKKNRWVFGGNRTGKTECGAVETIYLARGIHPFRENKPNTSGWVVSLSTQVQRDVAQSKILNYLNPDWIEDIVMLSGRKDSLACGIIDKILIKNVFGGISTIGFKSCDQGREKFQGTSLDYVWFDEEPPYDIYCECKMRVIDKCGEIFGTMTPLKGLSWVYDKIYLNENCDEEVWCEFLSWQDNPFLDKNEIEALKRTLSGDELESRCYGKFCAVGGLVYNNFDETLNVIDPFDVPKEWFDNISIDPGFRNPLSCHFYAVDFDGNVYVVAEHYQADKDMEYHSKKILEIADRLGWPRNSAGKLSALIDSAANQTTLASTKSVASLFFDYGICVNTNVNKDLFSGINRVKSLICNSLGERKLFIFRNCVNMIREIKGYFWGNGDNPIKKDDHAMDELRYYVMTKPENHFKEIKNNIQKDKERLFRKAKNERYGKRRL